MDTAYITKYYLQRPQSMLHWPMGWWFNAVLDMKDADLNYAESQRAKEIIVEKKYNEIPYLEEAMDSFNKRSGATDGPQ